MEFSQWIKIIKTWVNSLNLIEHPISSISEISDGVFLTKFLKKLNIGLNKCEDNDWEDSPAQNIITRYLEREFKEYLNEAKLDLDSDEDLLCLTSLFLFASCIKHDMPWAKSPLCHLENAVQLQVKQFMQAMINARCYTRTTVKNAIIEIKGDEGIPVTSDFESPRSRFTETPKIARTTLKDFFDSPVAQKRILAEKVNQINRLNRQLLEEQSENADLQELVQSLQKEIIALKAVTEEKSDQVKTLKLELLEKSESCDQNENSACTVKERLLKKEIRDLETYVNRLESDITSVREDLKSTTYKLRCAEREKNVLKSQCDEIEKNYEVSQANLKILEEMLNQTQKLCKDQGDCIQALEKQSAPNVNVESPGFLNVTSPEDFRTSGEENLGKTVVDLVLQETENEIVLLNEKISVLKREVNDKNTKILSQQQIIEAQELALSELENEKAHIRESSKLKESEVECLKEELLAKELIISGLHDENEGLKNEQNQLRDDMVNKLHEISNLKSNNRQLEHSVSDYIRKVKDSEEQISFQKIKLDAVTQDVANTVSDIMEYSLTFKEDVDNRLYNLNEYVLKSEDAYIIKVNNISHKIEKLETIMSKSNMKLFKVQEESAILKDELQSKMNDINNLKGELNKNCISLNKLEDENKNMKLKQKSLMEDVNMKLIEISELKENKLKLETDLNHTSNKLLNAEHQILLLKDKLDKAEAEVSCITSEKVELTNELSEKLKLLNKELHEAQYQIICMCSEKEKLEAKLHDQIEINNHLSKEIIDLKTYCDITKSSSAALEKELRNEISILTTEKNDVANILTDCVNQLHRKQQEVRRLNNESEKIRVELTESLTSMKKEKSIIMGEINSKTEELEKLKEELINMDLNTKKIKDEYNMLREEKDTLLSSLQEKAEEILEMKKNEENLVTELNINIEKHLNNKEKIKVLNNNLDKTKLELKDLSLLKQEMENNLRDEMNIIKNEYHIMQGKLECVTSEKGKLIGELAGEKDTIIKLKDTVSDLKCKCEKLKESLRTDSDLIRCVQEQNANLLAEKEDISSRLRESVKQNIDKEDEIKRLNTEIEMIKEDWSAINIKLEKTEKVRAYLNSENTKNSEEIVWLIGEIGNKEFEITGLKDNIVKLKSELDTICKDMQSKILENTEFKELIHQLKTELEETIRYKNSEKKMLSDQLANLQSCNDSLTDTLNSNVALVEELKSQISMLLDEKTEAIRRLTDSCNKNAEQEEKIQRLSSEIKVLSEVQLQSDMKLNELEKEFASVTEKCHVKCNEVDHLTEELNNKGLVISNLKNENNTLLLSQNNILLDTEAKEMEILELRECKRNLEDKLNDKMEKIMVLEQKIQELQCDLDNTVAKVVTISSQNEDEVNKLTDEINLLSGRLEDALSIKNKISSEKVELEKELAFKNNSLSALSNEVSTLKSEKVHLEQKLIDKGEEIIALSNEICALKLKIDDMEQQMADKNGEISLLASEVSKLQTDKIDLENKLAYKDNQVCTLTNEISVLTSENIGSLEKKLKDKEIETVGLSSELSELKTQKLNLEKELAKKCNEVSVLSNNILDLQSNNQLLINTTSAKEDVIKDLQFQIGILTTEKNDLTCALKKETKVVAELEQKINLLNCEVETAKTIQSESNTKLYKLEKDNECIAVECNSKTSEIKCLKAELEQKALMISEAESQNKELRKEIDVISDEVKLRLNEIEVLKESKSCIENELKSNHKMLIEKEQQVEKLQKNLDKSTFELKKLSVENVELTERLKETVSTLTKSELERNNLTAKISLNESKINELIDLNNEYKSKIKTLEGKKEEMSTDYKDMKSKYDLLKQEMVVLKNENKILLSKKRDLGIALEDANKIMKVQNDKIAENDMLKTAYTKLVEDNDRLQDENKQLSDRLQETIKEKEQIATNSTSNLQLHQEQIRNDYELRLQHAKNQMKAVYNSQKIKIEEQKTKELQQYRDKIQRDQDHIAELSSQLWNTNDRLLVLKQENEELKSTIQCLRLQKYEIPDRRKTLSLDQLCLPSRRKDTEMLEIIDETITQTRRQSARVVPSGMGKKLLPSGKVFPSEDEEGEVFDNTYLADLKAGRCIVDDNSDRISTLQYRNSLCPPHLKSSYPAETQFLATEKIKEDEIKVGIMTSDRENLLPGEKTRKKDKNQSGIELSQLATPRGILRENNSENQRPRVSTPARIKALFTGRRKDENVSTTPKTRKSIFFHFGNKE